LRSFYGLATPASQKQIGPARLDFFFSIALFTAERKKEKEGAGGGELSDDNRKDL
jgi:hypothetical protein